MKEKIDAKDVEKRMKAGTFSKGKEKDTKGKVRSFRGERAENGFSLNYEHEAPKNLKGKENGPSQAAFEPPKQHVFPDKASMLAHLDEHLED